MASQDLDLNQFSKIIDEYSAKYKNPPKNAHHLVEFCKDNDYNYKYGELNQCYAVWHKQQKKQKQKSESTKGNESTPQSTPQSHEIDWDSFWDEYETAYNYPPKKAIHLWNFAKEEKFVSVKYKMARLAFDRINRQKMSQKMNESTVEGHTQTDSGSKTSNDQNNVLRLKVTKYTSSDDLALIKEKFLELLQRFRNVILHDPASPLQLFNFINEDTEYKVRYGDVKKCYNYAVKHKWFKPMKRKRKTKRKKRKTKSENEGLNVSANSPKNECENNEGEIGEFVLEIDHETLSKQAMMEEEQKKEVIVNEVMTDHEFDGLLFKYNIKYNNPPRNASQIMNFAKEIGEIYKYKACRMGFNRWKNYRGAKMPQSGDFKQTEPGQQ